MSFRAKLENSVEGGAYRELTKTRNTVREKVMVKLTPLVYGYNVAGISLYFQLFP
jgi:hypothetical protein